MRVIFLVFCMIEFRGDPVAVRNKDETQCTSSTRMTCMCRECQAEGMPNNAEHLINFDTSELLSNKVYRGGGVIKS